MDSHEAVTSSKLLCDPHFEDRLRIDQEILRLEQELQSLRAKRNSLLPISAIPMDVLVDIFRLAVTKRRSDWDVSLDKIIDITWVCASWRKIALSQPLLWTRINPNISSTWRRVFLERSEPAHVYIHLDDAERDPEVMSAAILALPRIRQLVIDGNKGEVLILTHPAPVLQSTHLQNLQLKRLLFGGTAPRLTILYLYGCGGFRFENIPFIQLKELNITRPRSPLSIEELITGIASFPQLESLTLHNTMGRSITPTPTTLPHVNLPNLRYLSMNERRVTLSDSCDFICHISGHPDIVTRLDVAPLLGQESAYLRLLNHLQVLEVTRSLSLSISSSTFDLSAFTSAEEDVITFIQIFLVWLSRDDLVRTLQLIPLRTLTSLSLMDQMNSSMLVPTELWSETLAPLPNLRKLEICTHYALSFIDYIASFHGVDVDIHDQTTPKAVDEMAIDDDSETLGNLPFQSLRSLSLDGLPDEAAVSERTVHSFYKVLAARKASGGGLEILQLRDFDLPTFDDVTLGSCAERVQQSQRSSRSSSPSTNWDD